MPNVTCGPRRDRGALRPVDDGPAGAAAVGAVPGRSFAGPAAGALTRLPPDENLVRAPRVAVRATVRGDLLKPAVGAEAVVGHRMTVGGSADGIERAVEDDLRGA